MRLSLAVFAAMLVAMIAQAAPVEVVVIKLGPRTSEGEHTVPAGKVLVIQRVAASGIATSFRTEVYARPEGRYLKGLVCQVAAC